MESLLPSGGELWALGAALLLLYLMFGATARAEALPTEPVPRLIVLVIYAAVCGLLFVTLRRGSTFSTAEPTGSVVFGWQRAFATAGAFVVTSFGAGVLFSSLRDVVFLSYFAVGVASG